MDLKQYLMNCDLEDLNNSTLEKYEDIANMRMLTEEYWRNRISAENQSNWWSESDLQEHPLQQVSENIFIASDDDSFSNNGYESLSTLFSMAINILYPIPCKSEKFCKTQIA